MPGRGSLHNVQSQLNQWNQLPIRMLLRFPRQEVFITVVNRIHVVPLPVALRALVLVGLLELLAVRAGVGGEDGFAFARASKKSLWQKSLRD